MGRLTGKVALITGTGSGQGRAAALIFAREGAKVVGCDMNEKGAAETLALVKAQGGEMTSMAPVNLSDEAQAVRWVEDAVKAYGVIDILYNNAGTARIAPLSATNTESWRFTLANELDLVYFVTRAAWKHLAARRNASIINTGSIIAFRGCDAPMAARGASKNALIGLTVHMAIEGGPDGIRANCISPGLIATPPLQRMIADPYNSVQKQVRTSPLGRVGTAEDVANVALFLASDESAYVTGINIVVDGGQTLGVGMLFGKDPSPLVAENYSDIKAPEGERLDINIDGKLADTYFFKPASGKGPWPGIIMYTDIMGVRPVFKAQAQRLADLGYVVLVPNLFYRVAPPFDPPLSIHTSGDFAKMMNLLEGITREGLEKDAGAFIKALQARSDVRPGPLGCVGYCMSGQMAIWTAAAHPESIRVIASFHGGHLVTRAPDSAHKLATKCKAAMYFAHAEQDDFMTPENAAEFDKTLSAAGVDFRSEVYEGTWHGFAIPDGGYNEAGAKRHWQALEDVLRRAFADSGRLFTK